MTATTDTAGAPVPPPSPGQAPAPDPGAVNEVEVTESASPPSVRVVVLAGNALVPLLLPSEVSLSALVEPTVTAANRYLLRQGEPLLPVRVRYEFARIGGELLSDKPTATLASSEIKHAQIIQLVEVGTALRFQERIEIISTAISSYLGGVVKPVTAETAHAVGIATIIGGLLTSAALIWRSRLALPNGYGCAIALAVLAVLAVIGTAVTTRRWPEHTRVRDIFAVTSIALLAACFGAVPHGLGAPNVLWALVTITAGTAALTVLTERYWAASSSVLALTGLGALGALFSSFWPLTAAQLGTAGLVAAAALITVAPKLSTQLARLPRQPFRSLRNSDMYAHATGQSYESVSPVEDSVPDKSMLSTEQVAAAARRASSALTGLCLATGVLLILAAWLAVVPHQNRPMHTIALVVMVAVVIIVRARRYKDRVQAVLLVSSAVIALASIAVRYIWDTSPGDLPTVLYYTSFIALVAFPVFVIGTVGWSYLFSPLTRKGVELVHYVLIAFIVPMALWVLNIFTFLRTQGLWWR
ncbi:type VII secretion integral membrane protein EccD [Mycobacteroides salmoniphilum]|uniref:type VII secretion integral membrane protein EccD n=1 Tax=Mycobacteroides salmoniphilum TaxID=404941 RepID=UPI003568A138